ncbi:MAG: phosphorylase [Proteobacteria bacterium]|nr:phosphorylase [Pseudomonadota bacterium]
MTILAVTGLKREAEIAGGPGVVAVAGGGDASLAEKLNALHGDIQGVISFGLAGGLSPLLKAGDVVVGEGVQIVHARLGDRSKSPETIHCDERWRIALTAKLEGAFQGPVAASDAILEDAEAKAALFAATGALAVDMESAVAGRFAAARKLPFAVLRVISDDARHVLPAAALVAMKPDGGIALGRVLVSLIGNPLQIPALIRTARTSGRAFKQLLRCRGLCGVGLAGLDL